MMRVKRKGPALRIVSLLAAQEACPSLIQIPVNLAQFVSVSLEHYIFFYVHSNDGANFNLALLVESENVVY